MVDEAQVPRLRVLPHSSQARHEEAGGCLEGRRQEVAVEVIHGLSRTEEWTQRVGVRDRPQASSFDDVPLHLGISVPNDVGVAEATEGVREGTDDSAGHCEGLVGDRGPDPCLELRRGLARRAVTEPAEVGDACGCRKPVDGADLSGFDVVLVALPLRDVVDVEVVFRAFGVEEHLLRSDLLRPCRDVPQPPARAGQVDLRDADGLWAREVGAHHTTREGAHASALEEVGEEGVDLVLRHQFGVAKGASQTEELDLADERFEQNSGGIDQDVRDVVGGRDRQVRERLLDALNDEDPRLLINGVDADTFQHGLDDLRLRSGPFTEVDAGVVTKKEVFEELTGVLCGHGCSEVEGCSGAITCGGSQDDGGVDGGPLRVYTNSRNLCTHEALGRAETGLTGLSSEHLLASLPHSDMDVRGAARCDVASNTGVQPTPGGGMEEVGSRGPKQEA